MNSNILSFHLERLLRNEIANRIKFLKFQGQYITMIITFRLLAKDIAYDFCSMGHILKRKTWFSEKILRKKKRLKTGTTIIF